MFDDLIELLVSKKEIHGVYFVDYEEIKHIKLKLDAVSSVTNAIEKSIKEYLGQKQELNIIIAWVRENILVCVQDIDITNRMVSCQLPNDLKLLAHYVSQMRGMIDGGQNLEDQVKKLESLGSTIPVQAPVGLHSEPTESDPYE